MRNALLLGLAGTILLSLASCREPATESTRDLGREIAGTWLGSYEVEGPGSFQAAFITTYHADGTAATTSARALGAGDPARNGISTTHHIQWEASGEREILWRLLHFGHDVDGSLRYLSRTYGSLTFEEDFESGDGPFQVEVFAPDALLEPLDPNRGDAEPLFTARGQSTIRRLHTRIAGHGDLR